MRQGQGLAEAGGNILNRPWHREKNFSCLIWIIATSKWQRMYLWLSSIGPKFDMLIHARLPAAFDAFCRINFIRQTSGDWTGIARLYLPF